MFNAPLSFFATQTQADSLLPHLLQRDTLVLLVGLGILFVLLLTGTLIYVTMLNSNLRGALEDARAAREQLRERERVLRLVTENTRDVLWTMDLQGRFTWFSPSIERLVGWSADEATAMQLDQHLSPDSAQRAQIRMGEVLGLIQTGQVPAETRVEVEQVCKDGRTLWLDVSVAPLRLDDGQVVGLVGVSRDMTVQRAMRERIGHLAHYDSLTDLPNRVLLDDRVQGALQRLQRQGGELALIFLDLDRFKPVNDAYGHTVGDELLQKVAERIRQQVRATDTVSRVGGDEFVVLLEQVSGVREAVAVAEKIRHALAEPFVWDGRTVRVAATMGVALAPHHGKTSAELTRKADTAMYAAKAGGRNCVVVYSDQLPLVHPMGER